ncbi:hypothetical protein BC332_04209 [Capsicum chinense]|nr:hypothetical protein BC332_04209 [Capsicum chinense]
MRVTKTTLSGLSTAPELLESMGGLADNRHFTSESSIIRSVKLIAESIARHIYSQERKNIRIFADDSSLAVNPSYIRSWLDLLSKTPRVAPFLSKNDPLIKKLEKKLADHTAEVNGFRLLSRPECKLIRTIGVLVQWPFFGQVMSSDLSANIPVTWANPDYRSSESRGG